MPGSAAARPTGVGDFPVRRRTCHHRRRGHPRGHPCRRGAGSPGRAARRHGVPGHRGRVRRPARLSGFGTVGLAGVEGTGSYGAGLARHLAAAGVRVVGVDRADRQDRHRQGESDPVDAVSAARAAQSGRAAGVPKGRDGAVEAIRALMVARRSARAERTQAINQARSLIVTGDDRDHHPDWLVSSGVAGVTSTSGRSTSGIDLPSRGASRPQAACQSREMQMGMTSHRGR